MPLTINDNGRYEAISLSRLQVGKTIGIRNVSPNGVFGNEVYGIDSEGFGVNPLSDEFRLCNSDEWRSINGDGPLGIRGYGGGGDMVDQRGVWIIES
ncbi:hypothetical protein Tco_1137804 [Tanacetum coccineum]